MGLTLKEFIIEAKFDEGQSSDNRSSRPELVCLRQIVDGNIDRKWIKNFSVSITLNKSHTQKYQ